MTPGSAGRRARARLWALYRAVAGVIHKPLMFADYYGRAYRAARGRSPDIVHSHDLLTLPVAALTAARTQTPLVYDSHELYPELGTLSRVERTVWRCIEQLLIRRATVVITVCDSIAAELLQRYRLRRRPVVVLNCARLTSAASRSRAELLRAKLGITDPHEPLILYQGGFAPNRGLETLVRAAHYLDRGVVVLMGWGTLETALHKLVDEEGLGGRVLITTPVDQARLLEYTAGAAVGVIPYENVGLNNYYTTPNKLFEYIAAGVPVIGSRFPELVRFIEGYGLGRTFDPSGPRGLADAVNCLLRDEDGYAECRRNAASAAATLNWEQESQKLVAVYAAAREASPRLS